MKLNILVVFLVTTSKAYHWSISFPQVNPQFAVWNSVFIHILDTINMYFTIDENY